MTIVSSTNTIGSNTVFSGEGHLYRPKLLTTKALQLTHGELHVSIYPARGKILS
jgi:hypothetical protein